MVSRMRKSLDQDNQSISKGDTLIRSYGEYWSRDAVAWDRKEMAGTRQHYKKNIKNKKAKVKACDAWYQHGIYALYSDFKLVYVGMAKSTDNGIGSRLFAHHKFARMGRRWDSFSWFGIKGYGENGEMQPYDGRSAVSEATIIRTLELVAILIADPPLKRSQGRFQGAERILQTPNSKKETRVSIASLTKELHDLTVKFERLQELH